MAKLSAKYPEIYVNKYGKKEEIMKEKMSLEI